MRPEEPKPTFSFFVLFLRRLFVIFGLPLSLCVTLVVTQWVREDSWVQKILHWETAGPLMAVPMAWVIDIFALFLIYLLVPKRAILKGQALRAALCTAPILELSRFGVGKFNSYCVSVHKVYGVLAAIPMVLLWIEVAWMVVLSGTLLISHTKQPSENA